MFLSMFLNSWQRYGASIWTLRKGENLRGVSSTLRKGENWRKIDAKSFWMRRKRLLGDVSIFWLPPVEKFTIFRWKPIAKSSEKKRIIWYEVIKSNAFFWILNKTVNQILSTKICQPNLLDGFRKNLVARSCVISRINLQDGKHLINIRPKTNRPSTKEEK